MYGELKDLQENLTLPGFGSLKRRLEQDYEVQCEFLWESILIKVTGRCDKVELALGEIEKFYKAENDELKILSSKYQW